MNVDRFRVRPGDEDAVRKHPPDRTPHLDKDAALKRLQVSIERLREISNNGMIVAHSARARATSQGAQPGPVTSRQRLARRHRLAS